MYIDQSEFNHDEAAEAEYESAMAEYYCRKRTVTCTTCGLEQTATESQLVEIGWTLIDADLQLCFQRKCILDRANFKCRLCFQPSPNGTEHVDCMTFESHREDILAFGRAA